MTVAHKATNLAREHPTDIEDMGSLSDYGRNRAKRAICILRYTRARFRCRGRGFSVLAKMITTSLSMHTMEDLHRNLCTQLTLLKSSFMRDNKYVSFLTDRIHL